MVHHGIDTPPLNLPLEGGGLEGVVFLRLKWIDKNLDVRYLRYCYMAYTEVRGGITNFGVSDFRFPTSDFRIGALP